MNVLAFGEILWDIIEGKEHLGGAPFNFAAHSAQCGNRSYIVSRVGTDHLGLRAFDQCEPYGVDTRFVQWDENYPTGTVNVTLNHGQPDYVIEKNVAYDFIDAGKMITALADFNPDVFYFGSLAQRNPESERALNFLLTNIRSRFVFYDVNLRKEGYTNEIIQQSLRACNVFKLNNEELPLISSMLAGEVLPMDAFLDTLGALFPNIKTVVITAAEKGCYLFQREIGVEHVPGVTVKVADAVGAGDAFSAAFMHMLAHFGDARHAASIANHIGAFVAGTNGAVPRYTDEIKNLLRAQTSKA